MREWTGRAEVSSSILSDLETIVRRWLCAVLVLFAAMVPSAEASEAADSEAADHWAEGPERWLLLPEERKALKRARKADELEAFVTAFWGRRDRTPEDSTNRYRNEFFRRVEAADVLYDDEDVRGSLTDRGRALILMGPPAHVTVSTEPVMAWDPASQTDDRVTMRNVNIEIWGYRMEDLPPGMMDLLMQRKKASEESLSLTLMFRAVGPRTVLAEGEPLLEAAAQAAVVQR